MAEQNEQSANQEQASGGSPLVKLIICGVISMVSAAAGFVVPYMLLMADEPKDETDAPAPPAFIQFGESVVNLDEGRMNRYLRVSITLQVNKDELADVELALAKKKAILQNWLLSYLGGKTMDDIRGAAGQNRLRRDIQNHFNTVMFPDGYDRVRDVLFEQFNVQ